MKKYKNFVLIGIVLFEISCTKSIDTMPSISIEQTAINQIKSIVGNSGAIVMLDSNKLLSNKLNDTSTKKLLSLEQFKAIYYSKDTLIRVGNAINRANGIQKTSFDDDGTGKPGLHKIQFYAAPISYLNGTSGINNSLLFATILNLWYETDINGRVIGNPVIFYSGLSLFPTWTQMTVTQISFNPNTLTNTFTIGGKSLYSINVFNQSIGFEQTGGFNVTINMSDSYGDDGDVRMIGWR
jgi:hypothetical protein